MPTSTDPKLNQTEDTWGVLWDDQHGFCWYDKGGTAASDQARKLRPCCQGTELIVSDYVYGDPKTWNGMTIHWRADVSDIDTAKTGPVYKWINKRLSDLFYDKAGNPNSKARIKDKMRTDKDFPISDDADKFDSKYSLD